MPRILTQVIDTVNKEEAKMNALYGTVSYRHLYRVYYSTCMWCSLIRIHIDYLVFELSSSAQGGHINFNIISCTHDFNFCLRHLCTVEFP